MDRLPRHRISFAEGLSAVSFVLAIVTFAVSVVVIVHGGEPASAKATREAPRHPLAGAPLAGKVTPPPRGNLYWGASTTGSPDRFGHLARLEHAVGCRPAIVMWFQDWSGLPDFPARQARILLLQGMVPMVTWEPWRHAAHGHPVALRRIVNGHFDLYLRRYAREVRGYGGPVFLRPMHEMDGRWYPWSAASHGNTPGLFVRAWRHIHHVFHRVGARNVTWVWSVNHVSVPDDDANRIELFYPGPRYVDWVGISGLNQGMVRVPFRWQSFDDVNRDRYLEVLQFNKPVMIAETGAPEMGGDKPAWIRDAFASIFADYPRLGAVVWFDRRDAHHPHLGDWRIDSSVGSATAFGRMASDPRVLSAPAALTGS